MMNWRRATVERGTQSQLPHVNMFVKQSDFDWLFVIVTVSISNGKVFGEQLFKQLEELFRPRSHAHQYQDFAIIDGGTVFLDLRLLVWVAFEGK